MATRIKFSDLTKYTGMAKMVVAIVISMVTGVWGVAMFYSKMESKRTADTKMVAETHVMVMEISHTLDSLVIRMNEFDMQLNAVHENTVLIGNYVGAVHAGIKEDLRTRKDAEFQHYVKITEIIEDGLKKKAQLDSTETARQVNIIEPIIKVRKLEK